MAAGLTADFERRFDRGPTIRAALALPPTGITALFGRSGCGKTTILRCIAGLERPQTGAIRFGDAIWSDASRSLHTSPQSRRVGYVAQDDTLFPHLTVEVNIAYGLRHLSPTDRNAAVAKSIAALELSPLAHRRPRELSGGQRQRVALARALAPKPQLVLLDEPLSALDVPARERVRADLRRLLTSLAIPTILVTHDRSDVLAIADHIAVMADGRIRQTGSVQDVFGQPADSDTAAIVGVETIAVGLILSTADALSTIRVGMTEVVALNPANLSGAVLVCIRGEDVTLRPSEAGRESARNRLSARVVSITPEGPLARIGLDAGFPLTALVTRPSINELGLREGAKVTALIKAPSVHLVQR